MQPFPGIDIRADDEVASSTEVKIYRLPEDRKRMARCSNCGEWFHKMCENIPDVFFFKKSSLCLQGMLEIVKVIDSTPCITQTCLSAWCYVRVSVHLSQ